MRMNSFFPMIAAVMALGLAACTPAPTATGINDPREGLNRKVHAFNKGLDTVLLRPTSQVYGTVVPTPLRNGVSNVSGNLSLPGTVVNNILQLEGESAVKNGFRFLMNTTFGLGGLLDPASEAGLTADDTDFGETLKVWGVGEGTYVETPIFGPSTVRRSAGRIVDIVTNPMRFAFSGTDGAAVTGVNVTARIGDRYRYSDVIDGILYESADSYAQSRLSYLENRRFALSKGEETEYFDPYEEVYGLE